MCIAHCPCISVPIPTAHCPAEREDDVQLRGRGGGQGCVFGCVGAKVCALLEEENVFQQWYYFQHFPTSFLSAGATRWPGMRQTARAVILLQWLQHRARQSCKRAVAPCPSLISGREVYPGPPQRRYSCTRQAGSNLPVRSGASSTAGLHLQFAGVIGTGVTDLPG